MVSPEQVGRWVLSAGWSGADAITATAIALRMGSDPNATRGLFGLGTSGDGQAQATAAYKWWKGQGWTIFPAYRDKSYLLLVPVATPAVLVAGGSSAVGGTVDTAKDAATGAVSTVTSAAGQAARLGSFLTNPGAWERITKIGLGVGIALIAVLYIGKKGTFDQGARILRTAADHAPFISVARDRGAVKPGTGQTVSSSSGGSSPARSSTPAAGGRHRAPDAPRSKPTVTAKRVHVKPYVRSKTIEEASRDYNSPAHSNDTTQSIPVVGKAKVTTARKLPGDNAKPRTGLWRGTK